MELISLAVVFAALGMTNIVRSNEDRILESFERKMDKFLDAPTREVFDGVQLAVDEVKLDA